MKVFWLIPLLFCALQAQADVCGLYQYEDFGDRKTYTLTHYQNDGRVDHVYHIVNANKPPVSAMLGGLCYCVEGDELPDPSYPNDEFYKLIQITRATSGPYQGCAPSAQKVY